MRNKRREEKQATKRNETKQNETKHVGMDEMNRGEKNEKQMTLRAHLRIHGQPALSRTHTHPCHIAC